MIGTLPTSIPGFVRAFGDETACHAALIQLRWPEGFRCPSCGGDAAWHRPERGVWVCRSCRHDAYLTAGSALHRSKVPLATWFLASYLIATTPGLLFYRLLEGAVSTDPAPFRDIVGGTP